jgi:hypothetical protein
MSKLMEDSMRRRGVMWVVFVLALLFTSAAGTSAQFGDQYTVAATYQYYERGFMVWRSDNGAIYVFSNNGRFYNYASEVYGSLPYNPLAYTVPPNVINPIMGFGQVWGNFSAVQDTLGLPVTSEASYLAEVHTLRGSIFSIISPHGQNIQVIGPVWIYLSIIPFGAPSYGSPFAPFPTSTPVPPPTPTWVSTFAAYQQYQNGFMIWRQDTQDILIFAGDGMLSIIDIQFYQNLPDDQTQPTPSGFINPINGFGRVWRNYDVIRNTLGWAISGETGYTATITSSDQSYYGGSISLPDGLLAYFSQGTWTY